MRTLNAVYLGLALTTFAPLSTALAEENCSPNSASQNAPEKPQKKTDVIIAGAKGFFPEGMEIVLGGIKFESGNYRTSWPDADNYFKVKVYLASSTIYRGYDYNRVAETKRTLIHESEIIRMERGKQFIYKPASVQNGFVVAPLRFTSDQLNEAAAKNGHPTRQNIEIEVVGVTKLNFEKPILKIDQKLYSEDPYEEGYTFARAADGKLEWSLDPNITTSNLEYGTTLTSKAYINYARGWYLTVGRKSGKIRPGSLYQNVMDEQLFLTTLDPITGAILKRRAEESSTCKRAAPPSAEPEPEVENSDAR